MNHFAAIGAKLKDRGLDAMLVTSAPGEFYAAGFHGEGVALITPNKSWYWTDSRYIESAEQEVASAAKVGMLTTGTTYRKLVAAVVEELGIKKIGFEDESMSVSTHKLWTDALSVEWVPASNLLTDLRMVKDADELAAMREAQRVTDEAFTEILNYIKPGVTESEIAARLTYIMACKGAERNSFDPIVATGANGSKPHAIPGADLIQPGQFITMDFGCVVKGYCSDMTRTVCLGKPSEEMELVYNTVLKAQLAAIDAIHGGVNGAEIHKIADDIIVAAGYGGKMGHGLGHSLGIEVHESPRFSPAWNKPVPTGAFLSVEPGIYLPGKFGVRIEDVVMLTDDGCIDIANSPKNLIIL